MFCWVHFEPCVLFFLYYIWQLSSPKSVFWQAAFMEGQSKTSGSEKKSSALLCLCVQQIGAANESSSNFWAAQFFSKSKYSSVILARWTYHHIQVTHRPSGIFKSEKQFLVPCMNLSSPPCSRNSFRYRANWAKRCFPASATTSEAFTVLNSM